MVDISNRDLPPWSTFLLLAAALTLSACGYGRLTVYDSGSSDSDDSTNASSSRTNGRADPTDPNSPSVTSPDDASAMAAKCSGQTPRPAGPTGARLLTSYEYANTVRDLLGYSGNVTAEFPDENEIHGFENNIEGHKASRLHVRKFKKAAKSIAKVTVDRRLDELLPCDPANAGEVACGKQFIETFLRRAFRRPPTQGELKDFQALGAEALQKYGFREAIEMVVQALLQSPQFLYRVKTLDGASDGETVPLDDYEVASRLSYMLWASAPDETLLDAAAAGKLETSAQIERQVRRMLQDPRAQNAVYQFHRQWLQLGQLDSLTKDSDRFPKFDGAMTRDWKESLRQFVVDAYFGADPTLENFLTSSKLYLSNQLAKLYGYEPKGGAGTAPYTPSSDRRAGLLTQPAMMAILANANQRSPIKRGVWVREQLLCQHLAPPPADMNFSPPDPDPNATTRERFREHTENPTCAGCHNKIDPIGFGFENYDALGRWHARENGQRINNDGKLTDVSNASITGKFEGATELAERLADSDEVRKCVASRWFTYAMGRAATEREKCALWRIQQTFAETDGNFRELLVAVATSDAFRYRKVAQRGDSP